MEGKFRDLEAELILEIKKVDWIESMRATGEIDDELAILEAKKLARSIAEILENDNELEELFLDSYNRIVKEKMFDDFTGLVDDSRISIKYHSKNNKTEEELGDIPDNLDKIVEYLSRDSVIADNPQDSKFNLRYYLALYLVYRIHDQKYFIHSDQKSKKGLYDAVWGELTDDELFNIVEDVHKSYRNLYEKDLKTEFTDYSYDTIRKLMNKVLPTKRDPNSMMTATSLNKFEQHIMLIHFLIYNTRYQRFLSNPSKNKVPSYDELKSIRESILMFESKHPVIDFGDELSQLTVVEDTFHFAVFNGITKLVVSILKNIIEIIQITSQHESLITLFWLEEVNRYIPNIMNRFADIFGEIKDEVAKYHELDGLEEAVSRATKDEETLAYSRDKLKKLFEKYDSIGEEDSNQDEEDSNQIDSKTTEAIFKLVVELFYQYEDDETAYER
ncbi:hypothetical protein [Aerococcus urinaeequi]|uniref:hypothetical protein n=1 Tax=Aerococcus urinaeequi TaxID=51665 RepID=UPI003D6A2AEA